MLYWLEATAAAVAIRDSLPVTALLSGLHVIGMAVSVGAVVVMTLRSAGLALHDAPIRGVIDPASRGLLGGAALSLTTGLLLVLPRASGAVENPYFQRKMLLLAVAVAFHLLLFRRLAPRASRVTGWLGAIDLLLWGSVAVLGCMYTLVE